MSKRENEDNVAQTSNKKKKEDQENFTEKKLILKKVHANYRVNKTKCMGFDPLLCIEWDEKGLLDRYNANNAHTKEAIVNHLNQYGSQVEGSSTLWKCADSNALSDGISQLIVKLPWTRRIDGHPDVLASFMIQAERKNKFIVTPLSFCNF